MNVWNLLSRLNKVLLPAIHKVPDLTRLSKFQKAIVGWKMWVTYRRLDAESAHQVAAAETRASAAQAK